jgi:hypothetical protein
MTVSAALTDRFHSHTASATQHGGDERERKRM